MHKKVIHEYIMHVTMLKSISSNNIFIGIKTANVKEPTTGNTNNAVKKDTVRTRLLYFNVYMTYKFQVLGTNSTKYAYCSKYELPL